MLPISFTPTAPVNYSCAKGKGLLDQSFTKRVDAMRFFAAGGDDNLLSAASPEVLKGISKKGAAKLKRQSIDDVRGFVYASGDQLEKSGGKRLEGLRGKLTSCLPRIRPMG